MARRYITVQTDDGRWNVQAPEGFMVLVKSEKHRSGCDRIARTSNAELARRADEAQL